MALNYTYTASSAAAPTKEVKRCKNWATGKMEFDCYFDGRYVGTAETHNQALIKLDALAFETAKRG